MARNTNTTSVRLLSAERRLIEAAAMERGVGPSTFIRRAAIETARREVATQPQEGSRGQRAEAA